MSHTSNSLGQLALLKFKQNFWGVFSFGFIAVVGLISIFAYAFAPDNSQHANQMHLSIHSKKPGFTVSMLTMPAMIESNQSSISKLFFGKNMFKPKFQFQIIALKEIIFFTRNLLQMDCKVLRNI